MEVVKSQRMVAPTLWLWLSLANPLPLVTVDGNAVCPTPKEVADRVAALLPLQQAIEPRDVVTVDSADAAIRVQLRRPDG
ncbi:MAG: hypothetical protein QOI66_4016, partial [Myxococcales bacterium]|nr:hypothetical protein [Myxococcales bacterium]